MTENRDRSQTIFLNALEISDGDERAAYISAECQDDRTLRKEVEELLEHAQRLGGFLDVDATSNEATRQANLLEKPGDTIGAYKLLQRIGAGGMGVVYMADQTEPVRRRVALKIIKPGMDTQQVVARFEAERQVLAMMDHPNIAKVLDAGTTASGRPYFVMELVKGVPITQYCDEHQLTPRERLELFVPVCHAIQHAHQKGIIHRDVKPSNVLVGEFDDRAVPRVIDFGVAKATEQRLTEKTIFTQFGQIVGTIDYMSPEQAKLNELDIDTRSDIYSLGVLLYELLTGETPFDKKRLRSAAFDELLRIIREEEPPRPSHRMSTSGSLPSIAANRHVEPRRLCAIVHGELDWIVMKALEKDRTRRYETANGFAHDIERYLHNEAVVACPPSAAYKFRKFTRRNKAAILATSVVFLALLLGVLGMAWQANVATGERDRAVAAEGLAEERLARTVTAEQMARDEADRANEAAERARQLAESERAAREDSQQHLHDARMNLVQLASADGRRARVLELLDQCRTGFGDESLPFEWRYWWRQCHRYAWSFPLAEGRTTRDLPRVAVSPDGSLAVIARGVWELQSGRRIGTLWYPGEEEWWAEYAAQEEAAQRNPDDEAATEARDSVFSQGARWKTDAIRFSPDGKTVAAKRHAWENDADVSTLHLFDIATLQPIQTISLGEGNDGFTSNYAMAFSPDGSFITALPYLISHDEPQEVRVWDVATGNVRQTIRPSGDQLPTGKRDGAINYTRALTFSPDGALLATAGHDEDGAHRTQLWDLATGECVQTLMAREDHAVTMQLRFSEDGKRLLGQSYDDDITVWDLATGKVDPSAPTTIEGRISPDGRVAVVVRARGSIEITEVASGERTGMLLGCDSDYLWSGYSHDGNWLVTANDEVARVWDLRTDRHFKDYVSITDVSAQYGYSLFAFSPDGKTLACSHDRGTVDLWDLATERRVRMLPFDFAGPVYSVTYSPDGRTIAAAGVDRDTKGFRIDLFDLEAGSSRRLGGHAADIRCLKFSPNGKYLASGDVEDAVRVWDLASGETTLVDLNGQPEREPGEKGMECLFTPDGYTESNGCVVWSPDSRMVVYTARSKDEGAWKASDPETGGVVRLQRAPVGGIVAFSPDGAFLAVAANKQIVLVDGETWEETATFTGHMRTINGLAFSPNGQRIASVSQDQTILWNVVTGAPVLTLPTPKTRRYCSVAFSPNGTRFAIGGSSGRSGTIHIYPTATENEIAAGRADRDVVPELELAKACETRGEWEGAIEHYSREIADSPSNPTPRRGVARCHLEVGRLYDAFEEYEHIVEIWDDYGVALDELWDLGPELTRLAAHWDATGETDKATETHRLRLRMYEIGCADLLRQPKGRQLNDELAALCNTAIVHRLLARRLSKAGESDEAIRHLKKAVEYYLAAGPDWSEIQKNHVPGGILQSLLSLLSERNRWNEAILIFRTVAEQEPENALGHRFLGDALRRTGEHKGAVDAYRKAVALEEDSWRAPRINMAISMKAQGDFDGAIDTLETAIALIKNKLKAEPENGGAQSNLRIAMNNLAGTCSGHAWRLSTAADPAERDPEQAVELAKRAIELRPENANHWSNLGVAQFRAGDFTAAIEAFEKADQMTDGGDLVHRMFFAMACWNSGDQEKALAFYEEGAAWIDELRADNEQQQRFRAEAQELLEIPETPLGTEGEEPSN